MENDEKLELRNQQLLLGDASAWEWSWKNITIIKNSAFWHALARFASTFKYGMAPTHLFLDLVHRIKNFLEPLAIASNITQADSAHIDVVLITFALFVYLIFNAH